MIDLHTHILPGVDDGPKDMQEALAVIENGVRNGVTTFALTPHLKTESDWERIDAIRETFLTFKREVDARATGAELVLGAEVLLTPWLPERINDCPSIAMNGGKYILVEMPPHQLPIYADDVFYRLLLKDIVPVLAHPERYSFLNEAKVVLEKWVSNGVMLQINSGSLNGKFGFRTKWKAAGLIKSGLAHLIASDIHSSRERYDLREGIRNAVALRDSFSEEMFEGNAERVIGRARSVACNAQV